MSPTLDLIKNTNCSPSRDEEEGPPRMVPCDAIKNEFLCAICLGILEKTVTSQECLHRFCQKCIRTSLQISNQECPTCRAKLTESTLRADPVFDNLIEKLFPQSKCPSHESNKQCTLKDNSKSPESSTCEDVKRDSFQVTSSEEQTEIPTKRLHDIPDDSLKVDTGTESHDAGDFNTNNNRSKRKRSNEEYTQADEGKSLNIRLPYDIETKVATPKTDSNNKDTRVYKQKGKESLTPKRRSLRIEALKIEDEKNVAEIEYNQKLSNGSAQVFFYALHLQSIKFETVEDSSCCYEKIVNKEDKSAKSTEDTKRSYPAKQEKERVILKQNSVTTQKEANAKLLNSTNKSDIATQREEECANAKECIEKSNIVPGAKEKEAFCLSKAESRENKQEELFFQEKDDAHSFKIPVNNPVSDFDKIYNEMNRKGYQEAPEQNVNISNNISSASENKDFSEETQEKEKNCMLNVSDKKKIPTEVALPLRRSQRFAASLAQKNITKQTASRKRAK